MGEKMFNIVPWRNADSAAARPGAREQSGQACAGEAVGQEAAKPQRRASGRFMQSQPSVRLEAHRPLPGIVPERKEDTCSRAHGAHPLTSFIHRSPKREDTPRPTAGEGPKLQARPATRAHPAATAQAQRPQPPAPPALRGPLASSIHWSLRLPCRWASCRLRQLSCCISLFTEPRTGEVRAGKLEEKSRSGRNRTHVRSLQAAPVQTKDSSGGACTRL